MSPCAGGLSGLSLWALPGAWRRRSRGACGRARSCRARSRPGSRSPARGIRVGRRRSPSAQLAEGRMDVVVVVRRPRLDEGVGREGAGVDVVVEPLHRGEVAGLPVPLERGCVQHPRERHELQLVVVDAPVDPGLLEAVEHGRYGGGVEPLAVAAPVLVGDEAVRSARVEERAVGLARHRREPVVVHGELARERRQHRQHLGRERPHHAAEFLEHVVEGPVLAHDHDEVLERRRGLRVGRAQRRARTELVAHRSASRGAHDDAGGRRTAHAQEVAPARAGPRLGSRLLVPAHAYIFQQSDGGLAWISVGT